MARPGQSSHRTRPPRQHASRPVGEVRAEDKKRRSRKPKAPAPIDLGRRWRAVGVGTLFSIGAQGLFFLAAWLIDRNGNAIVNFIPLTVSLFLTMSCIEIIRRMTDAEWEGRNRNLAYVFALGFWLLLPSNLGVYGLAVWPVLSFGVASLFAFGPGNRYNLRPRLFGLIASAMYTLMFFLTVPAAGLVLAAIAPFLTIAAADRFMERKAFLSTLRR